jgi:predicted amidohydrolase YtcJ
MKHVASVGVLLGLLVAQASAQTLPPEVIRYADTVLYNGKVATADADFTLTQAVAVRDGKVLKVGKDAEILPLAGPQTRKIDLQGKTLIPGIIDTHTHLHEYALDYYAAEMNPKLAEILLVGRSPEDLLAQMKEAAAKSQPGEWLRFRLKPRVVADEFSYTLTRFDLDKWVPNNPVMAHTTDTRALANSKAIEALLKKYDTKILNLPTNDKGEIDGRLGEGISLIFYEEIIPKPKPEDLAPIYLRELDLWAKGGVTTWSSSLGSEAIAAFNYMDGRGMLPIRLGYTDEAALRDNPFGESAANRFGNLLGHGSDYFWLIGVSSGSTDASYPGVCTTLEGTSPQVKAREDCRLSMEGVRGRAIYAAVKAGLRVSGTHSAGDKTTSLLIDIIEKASAEAGMTADQIREKRHVIDHCMMVPTPQQIVRGVKLGIIWSCAPKYSVNSGFRVMRDYGETAAHTLVTPVKSILDAGGRAVFEQDHHEGNEPFIDLSTFITRKDKEGRVWGAKNAVDRKTALLMATRWAAEYVLREKTLGSLEAGKWADLVILDKDYFTVADDDIASIRGVFTMVGGKVVYDGLNPQK